MESRVGFWPRLGAYFIDTVLVFVATALLASTIAGLFPETAAAAIAEGTKDLKDERGRSLVETSARLVVAAPLISAVYYLTEVFGGWSLGKLILGLRIGSATGVKRASGKQLAGRYATKGVGALIGVVGLLAGGYAIIKVGSWVGFAIFLGFFLALGRARQALHDLLLGTAVYRKTDLDDAEDQVSGGGAAGTKWI